MSTITTLNVGDTGAVSRTVINTNISNLNTDKIETSYLDTDTTLAANSDTKIATQKATKAYIDTNSIAADKSCSVYQTAATSLTSNNVEYAMEFGAEDFDTDSMHSTSVNPSRITFTTAGKYSIGGIAGMDSNNIDIMIAIRLNGTTILGRSGNTGIIGTPHGAAISMIYNFSASDYVEFLANSKSNSQVTSGDLRSRAWAFKI